MGRFGQKTGKGWYRYGDDRKPTPDPDGCRADRAKARDAGIPPAHVHRTTRSSSARSTRSSTKARGCSRRASPSRASDIDTIYVNGYGFPAWRGGPMFYADRVGLGAIYERIACVPSRATASAGRRAAARRLAREGGTFRALRSPLNAGHPAADPISGSATRGCCLPTSSSGASPTARSGLGRRTRSGRILSGSPIGWTTGPQLRPDRTFLAARGADGAWRDLTYGDGARRVAQRRAGAARLAAFPPIGRSSSCPATASSTRVLALAAMYCGVPYAPVAPAYSLHAGDYTTRCAALCDVMRPGLVFADDGPAFEPALRDVAGQAVEIVTTVPPVGMSATPLRRARGDNRVGGVDDAHCRVGRRHDRQGAVHVRIDRPAERRDQHAAHAVREPGADSHGAGVPRRRAAGAVRLAAVESHLWRQPQLRHRRSTTAARCTSTRVGRRRAQLRTHAGQPARDCHHRVLQRAARLRDAAAALRARRGLPAAVLQPPQVLFFAAAGLRQEIADELQDARGRDARPARPVDHRAWRDRDRAVRALHRRAASTSDGTSACPRRASS